MSEHNVFSTEELNQRLSNVRSQMVETNVDGVVITIPENIYYLTELDHWGFFACHLLVVPREGAMILVCRAMERITIENQVKNARFFGHADHEDPADYIVSALSELGLLNSRIGMEKSSLFLTARLAESIQAKTPKVEWHDTSNLVSALRMVKSPLEMEYVRKAAKAADAGMLAAINATRDGASDYEVAAECSRAMILAGSEYPGFGPFVRPTSRLGEEHTTWRGEVFRNGEAVFLEIAAAYRKYQAPMGRLVYVGNAPDGAEKSAQLAIDGMKAINSAIKSGAKAGDAIMTGTEGEQWPIPAEKFAQTYDDLGDGTASKKNIPVFAKEMSEPFQVKVSWSDDLLQGAPGDYLVQYGPGDYGVVGREIFGKTYETPI